jgi:hypothetical protein
MPLSCPHARHPVRHLSSRYMNPSSITLMSAGRSAAPRKRLRLLAPFSFSRGAPADRLQSFTRLRLEQWKSFSIFGLYRDRLCADYDNFNASPS